MRILKVLERLVVRVSVTNRAVLAGVLKIPVITIWLFELKKQGKVEYLADAIMLSPEGSKILH